MADAPTRQPSGAPAGPSADRDARIEQLLLAGLDEYFAGRYEQAIHVWTRVLFLDRGHARARAYIERARRALAERQRESEELFHRGAEAFHRGDARTARALLTSAVARGAAQEDALVLLGRLDRLDAAAGQSSAAAAPPAGARSTESAPLHRGAHPSRRLPAGGLAAVTVGAFLLGGLGLVVAERLSAGRWGFFDPGPVAPPVATAAPSLPMPSSAEATLARARELIGPRNLDEPDGVGPDEAAGLQEALRLLDTIRPGDPRRPEADELRARIERALLAGLEPLAPGSPSPSPGGRR